MIRLVLIVFTVYQLVTVPAGESVIANGDAGRFYAAAAFVAFLFAWAIAVVVNHDDRHPFMPIGIGTLW